MTSETETLAASVIDCRDQLCPKPIIMIKRALAEASFDQVLEVIVNDNTLETERIEVLLEPWATSDQFE